MKNKLTIPNLLQVDRSDGTFVMDCDSGIALIAMQRDDRARQRGREAAPEISRETALRPNTKTNRN